MSDNAVGSIGEALKKRLESPIFGTFALIWLFHNFQVLMIIAFGEKEGTLIHNLSNVCNSRSRCISDYFFLTGAYDLLWGPLWLTIASLIVSQLIQMFYGWFVQFFKMIQIERDSAAARLEIEHKEFGKSLINSYYYAMKRTDVIQLQIKAITSSINSLKLNYENGKIDPNDGKKYNSIQGSINEIQSKLSELKSLEISIKEVNDSYVSPNFGSFLSVLANKIKELRKQLVFPIKFK